MNYEIDKNDFKCPYCQSKHLERHGKTPSGNIRYQCHECGKSFSSATDIKIRNKFEIKENDFKCPYCESRNFLRLGKMPSGKFRYQCTNCDKTYSTIINISKEIADQKRLERIRENK